MSEFHVPWDSHVPEFRSPPCARWRASHPATIRRWRAANPEFAASFAWARQEGWIGLAGLVVEEVDATLERHGVERARWVLSRRTHNLAQRAPAAFAGQRL